MFHFYLKISPNLNFCSNLLALVKKTIIRNILASEQLRYFEVLQTLKAVTHHNKNKNMYTFKDTSFLNLTKVFADHCDGLSIGVEELDADIQQIYDAANVHKLDFTSEEAQAKSLSVFIDKVVDEPILV